MKAADFGKISLVFLAFLAFGSAQFCGDREFAMGECLYNNDSLIDFFDLPPGGADIGQLCQDLCINENECNYFTWNYQTGRCDLYHYFDLIGCGLVSGPPRPDLYGCLPEPGSHECRDFMELNCTYTGDIVRVKEGVGYPIECQNNLDDIGDLIGAEYFVYDYLNNTCTFYATGDKVCSAVTGPDFPRYTEACGGAITPTPTISTTTIRDSTTSQSTTTTSSPAPTNSVLFAGLGWDGARIDQTETWDFNSGSKCGNVPPFPAPTSGAQGAIIDDQVVICGGLAGSAPSMDCYTLSLDSGNWAFFLPLPMPVSYSGGVLLANGSWWLTDQYVRDTVIYNPLGYWNSGPRLRSPMHNPCVAAVNESHVLMYDASDRFLFNVDTNEVTEVREGLFASHDWLSCLPVDDGNVLVVGGCGQETQIYRSATDDWLPGPNLDQSVCSPGLVRDGERIILYGGHLGFTTHYDTVYELVGGNQWQKQGFVLDRSRTAFVDLSVDKKLIPGAGDC